MALKDEIDIVSRYSGLGDLTAAQSNNLAGINHRGVGNPVPRNTDNNGLTFFTRPSLNLSYDNLAQSRKLSPLLTQDDTTIQRAIRVLLDHRNASTNGITSRLVDDKMAFIPLLTNNLISISGWPDVLLETYTAKEGLSKETYGHIDGIADVWNDYDITATFRNIAGDPISLLFAVWSRYAAMVYRGEMVPYPDAVIERKIDYVTRIYRVILDPSRRFVTKIGACGVAMPRNVPLGNYLSYASDEPSVRDNDQLSFTFKCFGVDYLDPITIEEFNTVVCLFNPEMNDYIRGEVMWKIPHQQLPVYNYYGYPRIDPESQELEWYVSEEDVRRIGGVSTNG